MRELLFQGFVAIYKALARTPLRRVPGMLELSNKLFRRAWPRGNVIDVQGNRMYIDVNDPRPALRYTFQAYGMNLVHEEATTLLFKSVVKPGDVVLDLGANIGYFSLLAARLVGAGGHVYSFEPEPTNYRYLKKNIELNGFGNVTAFQKAISDRDGSTQLFICSYDSGHHTINQMDGIKAYARGREYTEQTMDVETVAVDNFVRANAPQVNVIKMDVEGAEALALAGMRETLLANDVRIFLEYFPLLLRQMGSDERAYVNSLLRDFGFHVYAIGHDYDMDKREANLLPISNFEQLDELIVNADDHVNLFLTKTPI